MSRKPPRPATAADAAASPAQAATAAPSPNPATEGTPEGAAVPLPLLDQLRTRCRELEAKMSEEEDIKQKLEEFRSALTFKESRLESIHQANTQLEGEVKTLRGKAATLTQDYDKLQGAFQELKLDHERSVFQANEHTASIESLRKQNEELRDALKRQLGGPERSAVAVPESSSPIEPSSAVVSRLDSLSAMIEKTSAVLTLPRPDSAGVPPDSPTSGSASPAPPATPSTPAAGASRLRESTTADEGEQPPPALPGTPGPGPAPADVTATPVSAPPPMEAAHEEPAGPSPTSPTHQASQTEPPPAQGAHAAQTDDQPPAAPAPDAPVAEMEAQTEPVALAAPAPPVAEMEAQTEPQADRPPAPVAVPSAEMEAQTEPQPATPPVPSAEMEAQTEPPAATGVEMEAQTEPSAEGPAAAAAPSRPGPSEGVEEEAQTEPPSAGAAAPQAEAAEARPMDEAEAQTEPPQPEPTPTASEEAAAGLRLQEALRQADRAGALEEDLAVMQSRQAEGRARERVVQEALRAAREELEQAQSATAQRMAVLSRGQSEWALRYAEAREVLAKSEQERQELLAYIRALVIDRKKREEEIARSHGSLEKDLFNRCAKARPCPPHPPPGPVMAGDLSPRVVELQEQLFAARDELESLQGLLKGGSNKQIRQLIGHIERTRAQAAAANAQLSLELHTLRFEKDEADRLLAAARGRIGELEERARALAAQGQEQRRLAEDLRAQLDEALRRPAPGPGARINRPIRGGARRPSIAGPGAEGLLDGLAAAGSSSPGGSVGPLSPQLPAASPARGEAALEGSPGAPAETALSRSLRFVDLVAQAAVTSPARSSPAPRAAAGSPARPLVVPSPVYGSPLGYATASPAGYGAVGLGGSPLGTPLTPPRTAALRGTPTPVGGSPLGPASPLGSPNPVAARLMALLAAPLPARTTPTRPPPASPSPATGEQQPKRSGST
ncbi:hypothetical protein PAPYR_1297 [Paratrimastix pyriformis]|uniref:Uncharacterized protein n=1 Tax=Paratrimastix pyriformis TaxID=342808 RepID=A0ABQ8USK6_9EUKA|nr:hypothetical protein PAPYR_1297 [Paratrimastix pyriformis]